MAAPRRPNSSQPPADASVSAYIRAIRRYPMLTPERERELARRVVECGDVEAEHALVNSHLRLVVKIAMGYRGYPIPIDDLIAQGNLGLIQAVRRFDPGRGFRFATYAMWWIRAAVQEHIIHSWSLVKMGTTSEQKKLFFNLRRLKQQIQAIEDGDLSPENAQAIATMLDVSETEVISMNRRLLAGDASLNTPLSVDDDGQWQDRLQADVDDQEVLYGDGEERASRRRLLAGALDRLDDRERQIVLDRHLRDKPITLDQLGRRFGVSRERVRQIETVALGKLRKAMLRDRCTGAAAVRQAAVGARCGRYLQS